MQNTLLGTGILPVSKRDRTFTLSEVNAKRAREGPQTWKVTKSSEEAKSILGSEVELG